MNQLQGEVTTSTIIYTGQVEIKQIKNNKKYKILRNKNAGTADLALNILRALGGESDINRVYGIKVNSLNPVFPVNLTKKAAEANVNTYTITFETLIPGQTSGYNINKLYLKDSSGNTLAESEPASQYPVGSNTNVSITWTLSLSI